MESLDTHHPKRRTYQLLYDEEDDSKVVGISIGPWTLRSRSSHIGSASQLEEDVRDNILLCLPLIKSMV